MKVLGVGRGGLSGKWKKIETSLSPKKKKRDIKIKLSSGWKDIQKTERKGMKLMRRSVRNLEKGFTGYLDRREKSSQKKKDGAIKDFWKNTSKALGKTVKKQSRMVGKDLPVASSVKSGGKLLRKISEFPPRFPF